MDNIKSVQKLDQKRSHWVIKAPAGTSVEFDSRVTDEVPGRLIAWESSPEQASPIGAASNSSRRPQAPARTYARRSAMIHRPAPPAVWSPSCSSANLRFRRGKTWPASSG
jgi:hypothetical protein